MTMIPQRADVVVIGGGPAGSTAANMLAQQGYHVVLLEQARHPRNTVGESVLPHVWKYIDAVGATDAINAANFIIKSGGTAVWRGVIRQTRLGDYGFKRPSLHVERDEFDEILLRTAQQKGVAVFEEVVVNSAALDGDEKTVHYTVRNSQEMGSITCRYVVDASGQGAVIANQLGFREFDRDLRFMSVWGYYENSAYVAQGGLLCPWSMRREVAPTTIQLGMGDWGWCWHIVQKEYTSVGLVLAPSQAAAFKAGGDKLESRFDRACRQLPIIGEVLADASLIPGSTRAIRDFAYHPAQLAGDGWCLAGDAAAFVDPINSAGVITACYTGYAAAWLAEASLRKPQKQDYYSSAFSTLVRQRLTLFRLSALPANHNSYPSDVEIALRAAQLDSASEQELLHAQTVLTDRSSNLMPLLELDPRLNYGPSDKYRVVDRLKWIDGAEGSLACA